MNVTVEIGFALAFVVQGAGIVWWASAVNTRVKVAEGAVSKLTSAFATHDKEDQQRFTDASVVATRLDERSQTIKEMVERIAQRTGAM